MGIKSGVEWCDASHNFWYGCRKVSPGCSHCYAEREMIRFGRDFRTVTKAKGFNKPLSWREPAFVFVNPWSDFFIEAADDWRPEAWEIIRQTPHLTYLILTKRPHNIRDRLPVNWGKTGWPNVWLGVSIETQEYTYRADELLRFPAANHFVSAEPLLGPLDLQGYLIHDNGAPGDRIDWVITGGESGPGFRESKVTWFRHLRDQCKAEGVPFFYKQAGGTSKIGGAWGGNLLDGKVHQGRPEAVDVAGRTNPTLFD